MSPHPFPLSVGEREKIEEKKSLLPWGRRLG